MFIATYKYDTSMMERAIRFGMFKDVTVAKSAKSERTHSRIYYAKLNNEEIFYYRLEGTVGVGETPHKALEDLVDTPYVLYREDVEVVKYDR